MSGEADKTIDWVAIEVDYRAGIKTLREIAGEHGITHPAITKRAKRHGWERTERINPAKKDRSVAVSAIAQAESRLASPGFVYVIFVHTGTEFFYKIGLATNVDARLKSHQTSSPFEVRLAAAYFVPNMMAEEATLHEAFAQKRVRGEWFRLDRSDLEWIAKRSLLA